MSFRSTILAQGSPIAMIARGVPLTRQTFEDEVVSHMRGQGFLLDGKTVAGTIVPGRARL